MQGFFPVLLTSIAIAAVAKPDIVVTDVAVIGGGVAGISAAKALEEGGAPDWILIEAQNRLGGRTRTLQRLGTKIDIGK
jgi:monoamine oxidase